MSIVAFYPSAAMGFPSLPLTPSDYASALSAYASLAATTPITSQSTSTSLPSADRRHASPALSQSNKSSTTGVAKSSSSRQSTPLRQSSTPSQRISTPHKESTSSPSYQSSTSAPSPKRQRLTPSSTKDKIGSKQYHADTAAFYKVCTEWLAF